MDFDDLQDDKEIQTKLTNCSESIKKIENFLDIALNADIYEKLSTKEKIDYDLFIAYSLNTLYWMYLRLKGEDPNKTDLKYQLNRIKSYMIKARQAHERTTLRPKVDQAAAERFVKHGIHYKKGAEEPPAKKKKVT